MQCLASLHCATTAGLAIMTSVMIAALFHRIARFISRENVSAHPSAEPDGDIVALLTLGSDNANPELIACATHLIVGGTTVYEQTECITGGGWTLTPGAA